MKKTLQEQFAEIAEKYVQAFLIKHGYHENGETFDYYWVSDEIGGIIEISDYFFGFDDIRRDIDEEAADGVIFEWYDYSTGGDLFDEEERKRRQVNYRSWLMGWRPEVEKAKEQ